MLIAYLGVASLERNGDWYYRTAMPCRALALMEGVHTVEGPYIHRVRPLLETHADVLVINMVADPAFLELAQLRRKRNQITILEYNDDTADGGHCYWSKPAHPTLLELMRACDGVQFSTWALHRRYAAYCRRTIVSENMIDARQVPMRPHPHEGFVVGWGGSYGHLADVREIAPVVDAWVDGKPDVQLMLMCDPHVGEAFKTGRKSVLPTSNIVNYYQFLGELDVGLAPLRPTQFNNARSDIKFLEYASAGVLAVLSDQVPYHSGGAVTGQTCIHYQELGDLREVLDYVYSVRSSIEPVVKAARAYAETRTPKRIAETLLPWYDDLLGSRGREPLPFFPAYDGATRIDRYTSLGFGAEEHKVHAELRQLVQKQLEQQRCV